MEKAANDLRVTLFIHPCGPLLHAKKHPTHMRRKELGTLNAEAVTMSFSRALSTVSFPYAPAADSAHQSKIAINATRDHSISVTAVTRPVLAATTKHMYCHGSARSVRLSSPGVRSGRFAIYQTAREYWMLVKRSTFAKHVIHERVLRSFCAIHAMVAAQPAIAGIINLRRLRDEERIWGGCG